jgi:hypothetical protein
MGGPSGEVGHSARVTSVMGRTRPAGSRRLPAPGRVAIINSRYINGRARRSLTR